MTTVRPFSRIFALIVLLVTGAVSGFAQERLRKEAVVYLGGRSDSDARPLPPSRNLRLQRLREVGLPELTAAERAQIRTVGQKPRVGVHRELPDGSLGGGTWSSIGDGRAVWQLAVRSRGAAGLRFEFFDFAVGEGRVWIHSGDSVDGPHTGDGPFGNGTFWTAILDAETAVIEYEAPAGARREGAPPFQIRRVAHQQSLVGQLPPQIDDAAPCNLDVNCESGWQETKKSVAHIVFEETEDGEQGTFLCSATLLATRNNSFKPYLLTAGHCIHTEAAARSLQTYWAYESATCNSGPPANKGTLKSANGGHLLAFAPIPAGDYALVLLPDVPSGVVFSGWDPAPIEDGTPVVNIHHPAGSYKRISFASAGPAVDVGVSEGNSVSTAPADLYTAVTFNKGVAQPGSSGSAIFLGPGVVAGICSYGPSLSNEATCRGTLVAGYARFSNAYPNISAFLEDLPFSQVLPSVTSLTYTGANKTFAAPSQTFTLTTQSATPVIYKLRNDAPWITITPETGPITAATPVRVTVTVNPKYFVTTGSFATTITVLTGAAPPVFVNVRVDMRIDVSAVTVTAIPNPVPQANGVWNVRLRLAETNGSATRLTGLRIEGVDYSDQITAFFGTNRIAALGTIEANLRTSGLIAPVDKVFEFFGKDEASGQTWYRTISVTFN